MKKKKNQKEIDKLTAGVPWHSRNQEHERNCIYFEIMTIIQTSCDNFQRMNHVNGLI